MDKEVKDSKSRFYQKVDTTHVAAMGMSCGGLMSYGASADPRIATVGIWNSGMFDPKDQKIIDGIHSSVIIITGGDSDIAHDNGKKDFEVMPPRVPIFYGVYPSVGHGGTYNHDNGGPFGQVAVAWLKWQLQGDTSAKGKGYFVGDEVHALHRFQLAGPVALASLKTKGKVTRSEGTQASTLDQSRGRDRRL